MAEEFVLEFARAEQTGDPFGFRFQPQRYLLRTGGGGFESAEFPWSPELLRDLSELRLPGGDPAVVQRIGETLSRFLEPLGLSQKAAAILAADRAGQPLTWTFRSAAAELYALPWELMTLQSTGQHVGSLPGFLLRYEWPETRSTPEQPSPRRENGRILCAWSAAAGSVPAKQHERAIAAACHAASLPFDPDTDVLPHVSIGRLVAALEAARSQGQPVAVLHLLCHGGAVGSSFGLVLNGEAAGESVVVDAGRLRQLLAPFSDRVRLVVLSACDSGNSGSLGNHLGSLAQTLHRAGFAQVIASRYPLSIPGSIQLTETLYRELLAESQPLETALRRSRDHLARDAGHRDWASIQLYAHPEDGSDSRPVVFRPYRGLLAFQPQHGRYFFGRDREIAEVTSALGSLVAANKPRFLLVAGASGSGKSSLVLAGAAPQLLRDAGGALVLTQMKPGTEPHKALDAALAAVDGRSDAAATLLVVDQLEEIFTHVSDAATRQSFCQRLWRLAAEPDGKLRLIATLRVDFIGECGGIVLDATGRRLDHVAYDQAHRVFIAQPGPEQLRAAIEGPAQAVGIGLEPGLTNRMLEAVGAEPGALPLLSYTLDLLWLRRAGRMLTQAGYDAIGQIAGALSQHADAILDRMSEDEQRAARRMLVRLVHTAEDTTHASRQRVPLARLRPAAPKEAAIFERQLAVLVDSRLILPGGDEGKETIEVAHEALIRSWPRLQEWMKRDRVMLAALAELEGMLAQWRQHKALLTPGQLALAEKIERDFHDDFPEEARQMLRASQVNQARMRWLRRGLVLLLFSGTVLFVVQCIIARRSNDQAMLARQELISLIQQSGRRPTPAQMLRTLARLRLDLELRPDLALEVVAQARELEPQNPLLLADQAEYLLAAGRLAEVSAIAEAGLRGELDVDERLKTALVGWSAAHFRGDRAERARWSAELQRAYEAFPDGRRLSGMIWTTELLIRVDKGPQSAIPLAEVLAIYRLVHLPKSELIAQRLRRFLQEKP